MAQATNTYDTYDDRRKKEMFFQDTIYNVSPEETPIFSMLDRKPIDSTTPKWVIDSLATPDTGNKYVQGDEFENDNIDPTTEAQNRTQISRKVIEITRTQEKHRKVGPKSELGYQRRKKGIELRRDIEMSLIANQPSITGSKTVPGQSAGLAAWLAENADRGSGGADGGYSSASTLVVAATDGTKRAFTKAILDNVLQMVHISGGKPKTCHLSPYLKRVFSGFMSDANVAAQRFAAPKSGQTTIVGAADTYQSDFGLIEFVPHTLMAITATATGNTRLASNAFFIDPEYVSIGMYDDVKEEKLAKTRDSERRALICEYTLVVKNEKAHGIAADLYGMTASS